MFHLKILARLSIFVIALCFSPAHSAPSSQNYTSQNHSAVTQTNTTSFEHNAALRKAHEAVENTYKAVSHVSADEFSTMDTEQYVVFDVRPEKEFAVSHIEGAIRIDPDISVQEFTALYGDTANGRDLVFYCSVGVRSSRVAERLLSDAQFTPVNASEIYNLKHGLFGWHNEDRPLVTLRPTGDVQQTPYIHPYNFVWGRMIDRKEMRKYTP